MKGVARKRDAAPSWNDLISTFGEQGAVRDKKGRMKGYKYPRTGDAVKDAATARKVYEMWEPQRRVATELSGARNAAIRSVRLRDRKTGRIHSSPERFAEQNARRAGMVEVVSYGHGKPDFSVGARVYRNGSFQRYLGENRWEEDSDGGEEVDRGSDQAPGRAAS